MTTDIGTAVTYGIVRMETTITGLAGAIENGQVSMRVSDYKTTITGLAMLDTDEGARQFDLLKATERLLSDPIDDKAFDPTEPLPEGFGEGFAPGPLTAPPAEPEPAPEPEPVEPVSPDDTDPDMAAPPPKKTGKGKGKQQEYPALAARRAESERINEQVREFLRKGLTVPQIAKELDVTPQAVGQRIRKHALEPAPTPAPAEPADDTADEPSGDTDLDDNDPEDTTDVDEDLGPESGPPEVVHAKRKPNPMMDKLVPALGAQRRLRALFAIGYDPAGLNVKLLGDHITVADVLNAQPSKKGGVPEIRQGDWLAIDELYQRHKDWDCTPKPGVLVNRDAPKPSAWANIDDPNENH